MGRIMAAGILAGARFGEFLVEAWQHRVEEAAGLICGYAQ